MSFKEKIETGVLVDYAGCCNGSGKLLFKILVPEKMWQYINVIYFIEEEIYFADGGCSQCAPSVREVKTKEELDLLTKEVDEVSYVEINDITFTEKDDSY